MPLSTSHRCTRRRLLACLALAPWPVALRAADAPLRLLVGAAAGAAMDLVARQIAAPLSAHLRRPVIVENIPSAGGILALDALRKAAPNGQTIALVHAMQLTAAPALFRQLPYDPVADFRPLGLLFHGPQVLLARPEVAADDWPALVALAMRKPGALRYATPGIGTPQHLTMELLKSRAGVDIGHVPYRGAAALNAVVAGDVELTLEGASLAQPLLEAGRLRALAVTGSQRLSILSRVPTFAEQGVPGIGTVWIGALAPRGLPEMLAADLRDALRYAVRELSSTWAAAGRRPAEVDPGEMDAAVREDVPRWREVVVRAGITPM
jgi:tripartite-type tricarboxylate transporter receptor subunit TctC